MLKAVGRILWIVVYRKLRCYQGGYAKCYRVKNTKGEFFAAKVITKAILQDRRTRQQLFAEINIHRSLNHDSIVKFHSCFEDDKNVYLIVELCENGVNICTHNRWKYHWALNMFLVDIGRHGEKTIASFRNGSALFLDTTFGRMPLFARQSSYPSRH